MGALCAAALTQVLNATGDIHIRLARSAVGPSGSAAGGQPGSHTELERTQGAYW